MGLEKTKELDNCGVEGEYWCAEFNIDKMKETTSTVLLLFKDKISRDAGKNFLMKERGPELEGTYLTGAQIYAGIKESKIVDGEETNWFADAEDILEE